MTVSPMITPEARAQSLVTSFAGGFTRGLRDGDIASPEVLEALHAEAPEQHRRLTALYREAAELIVKLRKEAEFPDPLMQHPMFKTYPREEGRLAWFVQTFGSPDGFWAEFDKKKLVSAAAAMGKDMPRFLEVMPELASQSQMQIGGWLLTQEQATELVRLYKAHPEWEGAHAVWRVDLSHPDAIRLLEIARAAT